MPLISCQVVQLQVGCAVWCGMALTSVILYLPVLSTTLFTLLTISCRPAPSSPPQSAAIALPAVPSSPLGDPSSQAIWSPDTPDYIPQYTCQYDTEAGQKADEIQSDKQGEEPAPEAASPLPASKKNVDGSMAHKQATYGSSSVAPFAQHRPGR